MMRCDRPAAGRHHLNLTNHLTPACCLSSDGRPAPPHHSPDTDGTLTTSQPPPHIITSHHLISLVWQMIFLLHKCQNRHKLLASRTRKRIGRRLKVNIVNMQYVYYHLLLCTIHTHPPQFTMTSSLPKAHSQNSRTVEVR